MKHRAGRTPVVRQTRVSAGDSEMTIYKMDDGTTVNTAKATADWGESKSWDGNNWISDATGSQWDHERLYRSRKGRYYVERTSQWQGRTPRAEWISNRAAAVWLRTNGEELPEDLAPLLDEIEE